MTDRPTPRDEHRARVRRRILDAATELVAADGIDFTVPQVAERSGVPVRTLYRYFPRRQSIIDALAAEGDQVAAIPLPSGLDGYPDWLVDAWANLMHMETVIRAQHGGQTGVEIRRARIPFYRDVVAELVERDRPGLTPAERDDIVEVCLLLSSSAALFEMIDVLELDAERAARLAARTIVAAIRHL
jgi:AcrR family transcriptional regulator